MDDRKGLPKKFDGKKAAKTPEKVMLWKVPGKSSEDWRIKTENPGDVEDGNLSVSDLRKGREVEDLTDTKTKE